MLTRVRNRLYVKVSLLIGYHDKPHPILCVSCFASRHCVEQREAYVNNGCILEFYRNKKRFKRKKSIL